MIGHRYRATFYAQCKVIKTLWVESATMPAAFVEVYEWATREEQRDEYFEFDSIKLEYEIAACEDMDKKVQEAERTSRG